MTFANNTPFAGIDVPLTDHEGRDMVVVIVKATFTVRQDGSLQRAEKPSPIRVNDELLDPDAVESSLLYPTDVAIAKRGTDVIVRGDAVSAQPVPYVDVAVKVKERVVPLRVHGQRLFYKSAFGAAIGPAAPFTRKPIVYERAYGGFTPDYAVAEFRNLAGIGVAKRAADLVDRPAPQIEDPRLAHTTSGDTHPPVGLGAIRSHWSPRKDFLGTYDPSWESTRAPLLPRDFDIQFYNVAHPSLVFREGLAPGDPVAIRGMTGDVFAFALPDLRVVAQAKFDASGVTRTPLPIDTVLIEPSRARVEIVCRKAFPAGRGKDLLRELRAELA